MTLPLSRVNIVLLALLISAPICADEIKLKKTDDSQVYMAGFKLDQNKMIKIHIMGAGGKKELRRVSSVHHGDKYNLYTYAWIIDAQSRDMVWRMRLTDSEKDWWNKWNIEFEGDDELEAGEYELYFSMVEPSLFAIRDGYMSLGKMWDKILGTDTWWDDHAVDWFCKLKDVDHVQDDPAVEQYHEALKNSAVINLTDLGDRAYESQGFSIQESASFRIYAIGEGFKGDMYDYGWILDANTRERVWEMDELNGEYAGGGVKNLIFREQITLDAGDYLVYFKTDDNHSDQSWNANPPYDPYFWGITIFPAEDNFDLTQIKTFEPADVERNTIIDLTRMGDNEYKKQGFIVKERANFRIYALGEGQDGHMYDYGWITDAQTGRFVWKMSYNKTSHAGGARKNREIEDIIDLKPGSYITHYQTDGSHSYDDWNMRRPRDSERWGISVCPMDGNEDVELIDYSTIQDGYVLAELTQIGDDEYVRKQFELNKTSRIRIYCLGEGDWDEMYDYGWIKNMKTGKVIWKMRYRQTEHAGGARKNRKAEVILDLEPGVYVAYYKSDDSHSYLDWNMSQPRDPSSWGISVYKVED